MIEITKYLGQGRKGIVQTMFMPGMDWHNIQHDLLDVYEELSIAEMFHWTLDYVRSLSYIDRININSYMIGKSLVMEETKQNG